MTHVSATFDQAGFRGRDDDGGETAASWIAAADANWAQLAGRNVRVRFRVRESAGGSATQDFQLQCRRNGGAWANVNGASAVVRAAASAHFADGDPTTQQLGAGTFRTGRLDEADGLGNTGAAFAGNDESEYEYCVAIQGADVAPGDAIDLRLVAAGGALLAAYSAVPTLTVIETMTASSAFDAALRRAGLIVASGADAAVASSRAATLGADTALAVARDAAGTLDAALRRGAAASAAADAGVSAPRDIALGADSALLAARAGAVPADGAAAIGVLASAALDARLALPGTGPSPRVFAVGAPAALAPAVPALRRPAAAQALSPAPAAGLAVPAPPNHKVD
jgi:hypothetical protein